MSKSMMFQKNASAARRFKSLLKFSNWLQSLPHRLTPAPFRLMQLGSAFWQSRGLYAATQIDFATHIGDEKLSVDAIACRASTHPDATYRLLRMLAAMGVFKEQSPKVFSNNRLSHYLRKDHPKSIRAMILMHNSPVMSKPWYEQLEQGIRNNSVPFRLTHDRELFDYMDNHAEFDILFSNAMDSVEALSGDSFATGFDWSKFDRVIDIGGSKGSKSIAILKKNIHLQSLVVDRSPVIKRAEQYWSNSEDQSLLSRISFEVGDVFRAVPKASSEKDIYLLSAVLHSFDDDKCIKALKTIHVACANSGARIALMEIVMEDFKADLASTLFDMQMFIGTQGRERTRAEWEALFYKSNMQLDEVVQLRTFGNIMVLRPR